MSTNNKYGGDHNGLFVARTGEPVTLAALAAILGIAASGVQLFNNFDNRTNPNIQSQSRNPTEASVQREKRPTNLPRTSPAYRSWPRQKEEYQRRRLGPW